MSQLQAGETPPVPVPSPVTQFFWDGVNEHKLMILRCQACGHFIHYPRIVCNRCQSLDLAPAQVSGNGTLYSHTLVMQAFHPYFADKIPYVLAIVALEEDPEVRLTTNIVDCPADQVRIGMPLEVVFREVAPGLTLPLFRPKESK